MTSTTDCLLDYMISADPSPIQTSTAQTTVEGRLNVSASAGSAVYCNQIVLAFPVGPDATDLYAAPPTSAASTNKWGVTTQVKTGRELGLDNNTSYTTFIYDCLSSADYLINYNLVLGGLGAVNTLPGDYEIQIMETSGTTNDPSTFTQKTTGFTFSKILPQFYLQNFAAVAPATPTFPTTDFPNAAPIIFEWESNGSFFQIFMKDQPAPIYAGTATTFTLAGGVTRDTTFTLIASVTGNPGQDTPQGGYQPVYLFEELTITVSNPILTPSSAVVAGTLQVNGNTTLAATGVGALTAASATVQGNLSAATISVGNTLAVSGATSLAGVNASGNLNVSGNTTFNSATVSGGLTSSGATALAGTTVGGAFTATSGVVSMFGAGTMLASGTNINQASLYAPTDGFAVAYVLTPGDNGKSSFAYGSIWTQQTNTWFQVQGGTVGSFGSGWSDVMNNNPNCMTIPVPAGTLWSYAAGNGGGNQLDSPIQIWWFPVGGSSNMEAMRRATESEARHVPKAPVPQTPPRPSGALRPGFAGGSQIGTGTLLASGNTIAQTAVAALTDGFAIAQVLSPSDNGKSSFAYGYLYTIGNWFQVQGGTVGSFGSGWSDVMNNNPNAICIPIAAGTTWAYAAGNAGGNQEDSAIQIYWFPMGAGSGETYRLLDASEAGHIPPQPAAPASFAHHHERRQEAAGDFIDKLTEALGRPIGAHERTELSHLLSKL
jgi:hypothetical protein